MTDRKLLLHVFPTFAVGGAQARFTAIANRFNLEWRHIVVSLDGNTDCRSRLLPSVDVTFPDIVLHKQNVLANIWRIRRFLLELRADVLITSNWGSIEWALANIPSVIRHIHTEDGFGSDESSRQLARRVWMRRLALRQTTVVLPSRNLLRIATDNWRLNARGLRYIPNGVDLTNAPRRLPRRLNSEPVIGTVAALRPEKNLSRLIRAFHLTGLTGRLVIVGDGVERAGLEALAAALGLEARVEFTGHIADPKPVYQTFDIFALSSDTEQMPLSLLEAMAAGLPVAATNVGDVRDMVAKANTPFIVKRKVEALARALAALMKDTELCRHIGRCNRAKVELSFDQEIMFQAYALLFNGNAATDTKTTPPLP